jgi:hypothetical protein
VTAAPVRRFAFMDRIGPATEPARLVDVLRGAMEWIEAAALAPLLDSLLGQHTSHRALFDDTDRIDHIGFLLPGWAKAPLSPGAAAAGFPLAHRAFPSSLVARELGRITSQRRLATQIFKAYGRTQLGALVAFEAFIPAAADDRVEAWIRLGVCNHVAVVIESPERYRQIRSTFASVGIPMSGFMYDQAVYLPGEDATMMYFDLDRSEHPFRIELRTPGDHASPP